MKPPPNTRQNLSSFDKTKIMVVISILGILGISLIALLAFLFRGDLLPFATPSTQTPGIPTIVFSTPDCGTPTLLLGSNTFQIETIQTAADGTLSIPPDRSGVAYWVEGTDHNYVFVLSPTPENLAIMPTITVGSTAKATWKNCNSTSYTLAAPQAGSFSGSALPDQSVEGITVFFQTDTTGAGFVFYGELTEEQISAFNTPVSSGSEIQAEIGLLETTTSVDATTIRIGVSIYNWGQSTISLSTSDISLTQPENITLTMVSSEPALPKEIASSATETIYFTFPRPTSPTATLKIFTVEYDIEGY